MSRSNLAFTKALAFLFLPILAVPAFGQIAPDSSSGAPDPKKEGEVLVLSPFEVRTERDVGYTAASALAGGRTDMSLKDIPAAVSVITREFIDDIAATSYMQISEWGVNSMPEPSGLANNPGGFFVFLRGPNGSFPSRNYFIWYVNSDSYATERYEFSRGPNGVLFGDGSPGGLVTIFSKQARFGQRFYTANVRADTWGGYSTRVDLNQPLNDSVSIRLNLLDVHEEHWRDRTPFRNKGAHLAASIRLADRTTFRLEGEIGESDRSLTALSYLDGSSYWDGTTVNTGNSTTPNTPNTTGTGVGKVSNNVYNVWIPGVPSAGISNWGPAYKTNGSNFRIWPEARTDMDTDMPMLPYREFNLQPENTRAHFRFYSTNFYLEHQFTDNLFAQLAYSRLRNEANTANKEVPNSYTVDVNRFLPGTTLPNPKYLIPYSDATFKKDNSGNQVDDIRAIVSYKLHTSWFKSSINAIVGSRIDRYHNRDYQLYRTNGVGTSIRNVNNEIRYRVYWDEPGAYALPSNGIPDVPGYTFGWFENNFAHSDQRKTIDYQQLTTSTQLFDDRLSLLLGVRRDSFNGFSQGATYSGDRLILGSQLLREDGKATVFVPGAKAQVKVKPVSKNAGLVYFVLPTVGLYANYSETFSTPNSGANLLLEGQPGVSVSKGQDYGIKFVLNQKVDARLNYYRTEQVDNLVGDRNRVQVDRIWRNLGQPELGQWRDTQSLDLKGWEFEMTANPTRNLRFIYNLALPEVTNVKIYPRFQKYVADNLAQWEAGASDPNNNQATAIRTDIDAILSGLNSLTPGATTNRTHKYTSNLYGTYTFRDGALKNLAVGLGGNFRGKAKVGNTAASAYEYLYSDSYYILSGHLGYERKFGKVNAKFQLNVSNILDNGDVIIASYGDFKANNAGTAVRIPNEFRYIDPRRFTLSVNLTY